jgi:5-formyltetrahydrofolate cyclo-ligase
MVEQNPSTKTDLRKQMRAVLAALTDEQRHGRSAQACARLAALEEFAHAGVVMLYMPLATEVDVTPVALRCFQMGKQVCVPKVDWVRRDMTAIEVSSFDDHYMDLDEHGLRTPSTGRPVVPTTIDLVIVPGLAFDATGHRLGRGGGFYDRFLLRLKRRAVTAAIAFDAQVIDEVPTDARDTAVDIVVTDRRVTRTSGSAKRR